MPSYMDELINQIKKKRDAKSGTAQGRDFDKPQMVKTTPVAPKPEEKPVQKPPENREDIKSAMKRELEMLKANVKKPEQKPVEKAGSHEGNAEGEMRRESPPKQDLGAAKGAVIPKEAAGKKLSLEEMVSQAGDSEEIHEKSEFEKEMEKANKELIESYGDAKIFRVKDDPLPYYWVPVARPAGSEKTIISTIKEVATRIVSITPYKIRDPEQRKSVYKQKILEILSESPELNIPKTRHEFYADAVVREMVGYGIIDLLIKDDELEEIMVIGPMTPVYVFHRKYEMMRTNIEFYSDQEIVDLVNRIARQVGRRVDISNPLLDARLPDGSRVNATIPPASVSGSSLTIRKFKADPYSMIDMVRMGTLSIEAAAHLWACVEGLGVKPANILIAGGTGSGKTTTLNVLASFVRPYERVITIEDTAELNLPLKHLIRLEGKPPGLEGTGEITLDILTKNSLRMRPDRIIVGEIRHAEAFSLFTAMNTGHDGCLGTVHSNTPDETIVRVTNPPMNVPILMLGSLDMIVVQHRLHDKKKGTIRRVTEIAEVSGVLAGKASTQALFEYDAATDALKRTKTPSEFLRDLEKFTGYSKKQIDEIIDERAKFLRQLMKNDVNNLWQVSKSCEKFLMESK